MFRTLASGQWGTQGSALHHGGTYVQVVFHPPLTTYIGGEEGGCLVCWEVESLARDVSHDSAPTTSVFTASLCGTVWVEPTRECHDVLWTCLFVLKSLDCIVPSPLPAWAYSVTISK